MAAGGTGSCRVFQRLGGGTTVDLSAQQSRRPALPVQPLV